MVRNIRSIVGRKYKNRPNQHEKKRCTMGLRETSEKSARALAFPFLCSMEIYLWRYAVSRRLCLKRADDF
jgi:hypothetical protein